ncbi:MAG TPA: oligosaccharide flippase family protein [Acidimicrobiia bacterium]|jgi:O-antigen/teichoic acid export membrane protein
MTAAAIAPRRDTGLRRALALSSSGAAGARVAGAVGGVLAARLLGPTGRGQLAVLIFLATAASIAAAAGLQFWVVREVARRGGVREVARVVRVHLLVMLVALSLVGLVALPVIEGLADTDAIVALVAVACAISAGASLVLLALPNGSRAMGVVAAGTIAGGTVYVAGTGIALATGGYSGNVALALVLVATIAGNFVSCAVALAWAGGAPEGTRSDVPLLAEYRTALRFGIAGGAGELVLLAMLRADVLLVAAFLPLRDVGLYAVATALAELLWVVPDGVAQVVLPTSASRPDARQTRRLLVMATLVTAAAGAALVVLARPLIGIVFGSAFVGASVAVPLLVLASLGAGVWKIVGADVVARGTTRPRLTSACAGLVAMLAVDLVAIPTLGIAGAALGSACGYGLAGYVMTRTWHRELLTLGTAP